MNKVNLDALAAASKSGIIVCRDSRTYSGRVTLHDEVDDDKYGFIVSDDLNAQKSRILLMLALTVTKDRSKLQDFFFKY
jgi:L-asparaginase